MATLFAKYGTHEESNLGVETNIAATTNANQATAYQLTKKHSIVTSSAHTGFGVAGVKLPQAKIGMEMWIQSFAPLGFVVYPAVGEYIGNNAVNVYYSVNGGTVGIFFKCIANGNWTKIG